MKSDLTFRRVKSLDEQQAVIRLASANERPAFAPNIVIRRGDKIIGSLSQLPTMLVWTDTKSCNIRDSLAIRTFIEGHVECNGSNIILLPATPDCSYHKYLEKTGCHNLGNYNLFAKIL